MAVSCTVCHTPVMVLDEMCTWPCGHIFHATCLTPESNRKIKCKVAACPTKMKKESIIRIYPYYQNIDEKGLQYITCTMCMDDITDCEDMGVTECGHVFHYTCAAKLYLKGQSRYPCTVKKCKEIIQRQEIVKLNLNTKVRKSTDKKPPKHDSVRQIIQECLQATITETVAEDLEMKIFKHCIEKWESMKLQDKAVALQLMQFDEKQLIHLVMSDNNIQSTSRMADVTEENAHNVLEINKLQKANADLQLEIETLKIKSATTIEDLHKANSSIVQMLKEKEQFQQETLRNVAAREDEICIESLQNEIQQLKEENEILKEQNEEMGRDLETLKEEFPNYDAAITAFMINELETNLQNNNIVETLNNQISILTDSNQQLKQLNEVLTKQLDCQSKSMKSSTS